MKTEIPQYFFRVREQDIAVFVVDTNNMQRRIVLKLIASIDIVSHTVTHQGYRILSPDELAHIQDWLQKREARKEAPHQPIHDVYETLEHLNRATQWAYNEASFDDISQMLDPLLLAMHDLRTILIHRQAEGRKQDGEA